MIRRGKQTPLRGVPTDWYLMQSRMLRGMRAGSVLPRRRPAPPRCEATDRRATVAPGRSPCGRSSGRTWWTWCCATGMSIDLRRAVPQHPGRNNICRRKCGRIVPMWQGLPNSYDQYGMQHSRVGTRKKLIEAGKKGLPDRRQTVREQKEGGWSVTRRQYSSTVRTDCQGVGVGNICHLRGLLVRSRCRRAMSRAPRDAVVFGLPF